MTMTPGAKDESHVPEEQRLGREVDTKERVELLINTTTFVVFSYVAQVQISIFCSVELMVHFRACLKDTNSLWPLNSAWLF